MGFDIRAALRALNLLQRSVTEDKGRRRRRVRLEQLEYLRNEADVARRNGNPAWRSLHDEADETERAFYRDRGRDGDD